MKTKLAISLATALAAGISLHYVTQPAIVPNQLTITSETNPNIAIIYVPRSNLVDEYILFWSPYSNCCYYPLIPDYVEMSDNLLIYKHDFKMPAFGYWQIVKR
jgi:hypothetical protein